MVRRICCVACLLMGVLWGGRGQVAWQDPLLPDEGAVLYRSLPNVPVYLSGGRVAQLSEFWAARPMLLVFVFSRCAGICSPLLQSLRKTSASVGGVGDAYQIVVLSFDPRDTPEQLLKRFEASSDMPARPGWYYGTVAPKHLRQLMDATGFWYTPIANTDQYDHPGMIVAVRQGRIVRVHGGGSVSPAQLRALLRELRGDPVRSYPLPDANLAFRCYRYDPLTGEVRWDWGMLALFAPPLVGFPLALLSFQLGRRKRLHTVSDVCASP